MPIHLDRTKIRASLEQFDLRSLFVEELGWDHGGEGLEIPVANATYALQAIAHKRGLVAYQYVADEATPFPDHPTRQKIERTVAKTVREHIIVYASSDRNTHHWQWVKREPGQPDRSRSHIYQRGKTGEALIQKLEQIVFMLDEEDDLTIVDVSGRVRAAFDVEKVTKRFYDRFKKEHLAFLSFIEGIENVADREWYASLMLNRMMFIYFIQKRGFLDDDKNYLQNRLQRMQTAHGKDRFQTFYRLFLLRLFHEGLGQPEADRTPELAELLGRIPYLNGGLFEVHDLERDNEDIHIPDEAFQQIFDFFDAYQWHLDDRPLRNDNEINPDVLGYIFEKYINQKQMGAYYTKEDITGYISRNTIIPFLFDRAKKECSIAFKPGGEVWQLLADDPDRYFYEAVRHGITYDIHKGEALADKRELPPEIAVGLKDVSKRGNWNKAAPPDYALPTETWREHVARRQHYEEVRAQLAAGEVTSINDLITYNLDIEKFAQDVIAGSEGPELIRAFWKAITQVSILDPTCGSGAFLFAALNILEPIYTACLETMQGFLDDLERSQRKHRPEKLSDFRKVLEQVASHASERYFILKSIIVDNLYGVDIMEEAVEICKLRLFLKLVAQLESYEQIEPLPDVDFNVRAGNTLVGFTTLKEIQDSFVATPSGQQRMLYAEDTAKLKRIEEDAEIADRAFRQFREMQTEREMDAVEFTNAKTKLRKRLGDLRDELDNYLADDYGVKTGDERAYRKWRDSHQPFHWFVEFYGIMDGGGFDVIIGNPPYIELKVVDQYKLKDYECIGAGNLYALILERSLKLCHRLGRQGFIVPVSSVSTDRYVSLQNKLSQHLLHYSSFDDRPSRLFDGLQHIRLTIHLIAPSDPSAAMYSTRYNKWTSVERPSIFHRLRYEKSYKGLLAHTLPKLCSELEYEISKKLKDERKTLANFYVKNTRNYIYYTRKVGYFLQFLDFEPLILNGAGNRRSPSELKVLRFGSELHAKLALCCLNSNLFYWFFTVCSDCRNVNKREIDAFPIDVDRLAKHGRSERLVRLAEELMEDLDRNSEERQMKFSHDTLKVQCVFPKYSKLIIDEIDRVLAEHYGFTDEELDFIINYDIKYRMGLETSSKANTNDLLKLAAKVYEGLSDADLDDMEEIIHDRRNFFGDRTQ